MTQFDEDIDYDTDSEPSGTDLVKHLRRQVNELTKTLKEKDQQLSDFYTQSREADIAVALEEMGVNPKIAAFIPDDVESIVDLEQWLNEYGDVFGVSVMDNSGVNMDAESVHAAELMSAVENGGVDPQVGQDLAARIASAKSADELAALLHG